MPLPKDPVLLLSVVNMKLRDFYSNLDALCDDLDCNRAELEVRFMYNNISDWDRMVAGKLYNSASRDIFKRHALGLTRCERFNKIALWRILSKQRALERLIPSAKGKKLAVFAPFYCEYGVNILVGKGCFVNYNCTFLDVAPITLGNNVWIGANVTLATPNHPFIAEERLPADYPDGNHDLEYALPIAIKDNCWICSSATICGGVTVGLFAELTRAIE